MKTTKQRFEENFHVTPGCWLWTASLDRYGYGKFKVSGKTAKAHRYAYLIYVSADVDDLYVMHRCDNPKCVNPNHLFAGTASDNAKDRETKGRRGIGSGWPANQGIDHGRAKLTESEVQAIRNDTRFQREIAEHYGIGRSQVSRIKNGENWLLI